MKNKPQILLVHGGMTFRSRKDYLKYLRTRKISLDRKRWSDEYLNRMLGKTFEIIRPRMPQSDDASYGDWKIHFERYIPFLRHGAILVGNSLGGIFLAKYLSEYRFPKKLSAVFLVCPPFDNTLPGEDLVNGFTLKRDLSRLAKSTKNLHFMFSEDDDVVPIAHAEKFRSKLEGATFHIYKSKGGHFNVSEFPEIVKLIRTLRRF